MTKKKKINKKIKKIKNKKNIKKKNQALSTCSKFVTEVLIFAETNTFFSRI